jgi:Zn-dependent peptidase ImmA (M78 family)
VSTLNATIVRVAVAPELLRWARERVGWDLNDAAAHRFPKLADWEQGKLEPTLRQLEHFAKATHVPIGYLFLKEPPEEMVPIPDLRTVADRPVEHPSPDLLDTIYICQQRQEWYRDFVRSQRGESLAFVGSASLTSNVELIATRIRMTLGFDIQERRQSPTWTEALRRFIEQADAIGVLVMVNGVVGNNTHRRLDPDEFRGFALSDELAPLVFINGADTKAAQMFTLAHELAHIWLGKSALSDVQPVSTPTDSTERWCNKVAAEVLVPLAALRDNYQEGEELRLSLDRLARLFKVSTLVILRRLYDNGGLTRKELAQAYNEELEQLRETRRGSGGDFYLTEAARVGKRFARALVASTLEGHTLYRDAFHLLGFSKSSTFHELAHSLGVS